MKHVFDRLIAGGGRSSSVLPLVVVAILATVAVGTATAQTLPLSSVTLFTSGVGEFVHVGTPNEDGAIRLNVPANQMADVVRSITVLDAGGRPVTDITFAAGETPATALQRYRIDLNRVSDLISLATESRGLDVELTTLDGERVSGTIIGAARNATALTSSTVRADRIAAPPGTITVSTREGTRSIAAASVERFHFTDPEIRAEYAAASELLANAGGPEAPRELVISLGSDRRGGAGASGSDGGAVTLRYLREMPLWRASYRAVLSNGEVILQGWAHVDNVGSTDWNDVTLAIVSARPVTYAADLYTPRYAVRSPQPDTPGIARIEPQAMRSRADSMEYEVADALPAATAVSAEGEQFRGGIAFTLPNPVSIPRGRSAMIPIVDDTFAIDLVRSFDPRRDTRNPRLSFTFRNASGAQLPDGIVTVYDGDRYVGDSILPVLADGAEATLPYAVDLEHEVTVDGDVSDEELRNVTIVDGLLVEERRTRRTTRYTIETPGRSVSPEPIRITHHLQSGWELRSPRAIDERGNERVFRTSGTRLTVIEERVREQRVLLTSADTDQLVAYSGNRLINPTIRRTLQNVVELRRQLEDARNERSGVAARVAEIVEEQERIRGNMQALERDSSLYRRYVRTLDSQEDQLGLLQEELRDAQEREDNAEAALREYIRTLSD